MVAQSSGAAFIPGQRLAGFRWPQFRRNELVPERRIGIIRCDESIDIFVQPVPGLFVHLIIDLHRRHYGVSYRSGDCVDNLGVVGGLLYVFLFTCIGSLNDDVKHRVRVVASSETPYCRDVIGYYVRTVIYDAKTGHESASHIAQAQLYMYLLPKAQGGRWRGVKFKGVVVYANGSERRISADSVDDAFVSRLGEFMRKMTSDMPPRRVPSLAECNWCELTHGDCPDRMEPELN